MLDLTTPRVIPNKIKTIELNKKEQIKNNTEFIGFAAEIINTDELIKNIYIIMIKDVYIFFLFIMI